MMRMVLSQREKNRDILLVKILRIQGKLGVNSFKAFDISALNGYALSNVQVEVIDERLYGLQPLVECLQTCLNVDIVKRTPSHCGPRSHNKNRSAARNSCTNHSDSDWWILPNYRARKNCSCGQKAPHSQIARTHSNDADSRAKCVHKGTIRVDVDKCAPTARHLVTGKLLFKCSTSIFKLPIKALFTNTVIANGPWPWIG